jgi:hypothetical protein
MKTFKEIEPQILQESGIVSPDEFNSFCLSTFQELFQLYNEEISSIIEKYGFYSLEKQINFFLNDVISKSFKYEIISELGLIQVQTPEKLIHSKLVFPSSIVPKNVTEIERIFLTGYICSIFDKLNLYFAITKR